MRRPVPFVHRRRRGGTARVGVAAGRSARGRTRRVGGFRGEGGGGAIDARAAEEASARANESTELATRIAASHAELERDARERIQDIEKAVADTVDAVAEQLGGFKTTIEGRVELMDAKAEECRERAEFATRCADHALGRLRRRRSDRRNGQRNGRGDGNRPARSARGDAGVRGRGAARGGGGGAVRRRRPDLCARPD